MRARLPLSTPLLAATVALALLLPACGKSDCTYSGQTYAHGESFDDIDGCNTCTCEDGQVACTEMACDTDA